MEQIRLIYLEDLPKKIRGNVCVVDWERSIGEYCVFTYDDIDGEFKILKYNKKQQKITIVIDGKDEYETTTGSILKNNIGRYVKDYGKFILKIGDVFSDLKRNIEITDVFYDITDGKKHKMCKYKCHNCGWEEGASEESNIILGNGCSCCRGITPVKGINTIGDIKPELIKYFKNKEDAFKHTYGSGNKVIISCVNCGKEKEIKVHNISDKCFLTCECSDGISYPNKYMYYLLKQLDINFTREKRFDWSCGKIYDFYVKNKNIIIEVNGEQHYRKTFSTTGGRTIDEEVANDLIKWEMAINNGVLKYEAIDCRKSNLKWIKNSVMNSRLPELLNFTEDDIDWLKCHELALKNIVKEVCDYKRNNADMFSTEIAKVFNIAQCTVIDYLKKGNELNWCEYDPKKEMSRRNKMKLNKGGKMVEVFKDSVSLGVFNSCSEVERISEEMFGTKLFNSMVSKVANGNHNSYKGFCFKYIE